MSQKTILVMRKIVSTIIMSLALSSVVMFFCALNRNNDERASVRRVHERQFIRGLTHHDRFVALRDFIKIYTKRREPDFVNDKLI